MTITYIINSTHDKLSVFICIYLYIFVYICIKKLFFYFHDNKLKIFILRRPLFPAHNFSSQSCLNKSSLLTL